MGAGPRFPRDRMITPKTIVICYAAAQHYLSSGLGRNNRKDKTMTPTTFLIGLAALTACKIAARIGVNAAHFEGLPRPTQID